MFTVAHRVDSTRATSRELTEWLDAQCEVDSASAHRDQPGRVTGTRELTLPPLPFIIRLSRAARGGGDRQDHPSRVQRWPQTPASRSSSGSARPYPSHLPPAECWSHWQPPGRGSSEAGVPRHATNRPAARPAPRRPSTRKRVVRPCVCGIGCGWRMHLFVLAFVASSSTGVDRMSSFSASGGDWLKMCWVCGANAGGIRRERPHGLCPAQAARARHANLQGDVLVQKGEADRGLHG